MPSFVKRHKKTVNPAGGVNPALEPNVGQYGWTSYDAANVNQIIQYVDLCKKYAEEAKGAAEYIQSTYEGLKDLIIYLEEIYGKIKPIADSIESMYIDVSRWHKEVMVARIEVDLDRIKAAESAAGAKLSEETAIEAATSAFRSKIAAKDSEDQSLIYLEESRGLAEELRAGQVYRGTWNPKTAAWPDNGGTNSVWDVILDAGTSSIDYGGFTWNAGDRLLYIVAETKYDQLKTGSGVLSVNGLTGAVTLDAAAVGAIPVSGGDSTGILGATHFTITNPEGYIQDYGGNGLLQTTDKYGAVVVGNGTKDTYLHYKDGLIARNKNNMDYQIYHEGRKPSPQELGAMVDTATINGKLVKTNPTITLAELGGYPTSGGHLGGPMVSRDVVRVNSAANPIMELHAEGTTAAMLWIDKSNSYLNLSRSTGSSVEASRLMSFLDNGVSKFYNALESTSTLIARSFNGQKYVAFEAHDTSHPLISFDPADGGGARVGITFNGKEIAFAQRPAAGDIRVGNDGGLKFSPYGDFSGVSWGMGVNGDNGWLNIHQYQNGVWAQAPLQFDPFGRTTYINNTMVTGNHRIKQPAGSIPAQEYLVEGVHAAMWYLHPQNASMVLATTNGGFDASKDRMVITAHGDVVAGYRVISNYNGNRAWGNMDEAAFVAQLGASSVAGALNGLISRRLHNPGQWNLEQFYGSYSSTNDPNHVEHVFSVNDGGAFSRPWRLRSDGLLMSPGYTVGGGMAYWTIHAGGMIDGTTWGGQLDSWIALYYQPKSDAQFKKNIQPSTKSALDDVKRIEFKSFDWEEGHSTKDDVRVEIGMISQDLEAIDTTYTRDIPITENGEVVNHSKSLDTANLLSLALKAIQELEERVAILEGRP